MDKQSKLPAPTSHMATEETPSRKRLRMEEGEGSAHSLEHREPDEIDMLSSEFLCRENKIIELQKNQMESFVQLCKKWKEKRRSYETKIQEMKEEVAWAHVCTKKAKDEVAKVKAHLDSAANKSKEHDDAMEEFTGQFTAMVHQRDDQRRENRALESKLENKKQALDEAREEISVQQELLNKIDKPEAVDLLLQSNQSLTAANNRIGQLVEGLKGQLKDRTEENDSLKSQLLKQRETIEALLEVQAVLDEDLQEEQSKIRQDLQKQNWNLKNLLKQNEAEWKTKHDELVHDNSKLKIELEKNAASMKLNAERLSKTMEDLKAKVIELEEIKNKTDESQLMEDLKWELESIKEKRRKDKNLIQELKAKCCCCQRNENDHRDGPTTSSNSKDPRGTRNEVESKRTNAHEEPRRSPKAYSSRRLAPY